MDTSTKMQSLSPFNQIIIFKGMLSKAVSTNDTAINDTPEQFDALLKELSQMWQPVSPYESMLVETIAVQYWRLSMLYHIEEALFKSQMAVFTHNVDDEKHFNVELPIGTIRSDMEKAKKKVVLIRQYFKDLKQIQDKVIQKCPVTEFYQYKALWELIGESSVEELGGRYKDGEVIISKLREKQGYEDKDIEQLLIRSCTKFIDYQMAKLEEAEKELMMQHTKAQKLLEVLSTPNNKQFDQIVKREAIISKQLYDAINRLEKHQKERRNCNSDNNLQMQFDLCDDRGYIKSTGYNS